MKKIAAFVLMALISTGAGRAAVTTVSLEGGQFEPESRNCVRDDKRITGAAKLYGSFGYGTAVYEFQVSGKAENLGAEVDFINPKKKRLSIYLFNFGSAKDANPARARDLDPKWWLWGDSQEDNWATPRPPADQEASDGTGKVAFVSPQGKVRMLLHAPGGIPYLSDGLFFISRVGLKVGTTEAELTGFQTSEDAWMEGGLVLAKGIGKPPQGVNPARGRILALRAAKAVAMRNLLLSMGEVRREDGTLYVQGTLVGVKVREEKTLPDGSVEVVVEMPVE